MKVLAPQPIHSSASIFQKITKTLAVAFPKRITLHTIWSKDLASCVSEPARSAQKFPAHNKFGRCWKTAVCKQIYHKAWEGQLRLAAGVRTSIWGSNLANSCIATREQTDQAQVHMLHKGSIIFSITTKSISKKPAKSVPATRFLVC